MHQNQITGVRISRRKEIFVEEHKNEANVSEDSVFSSHVVFIDRIG
jgi:hypothetical protein